MQEKKSARMNKNNENMHCK